MADSPFSALDRYVALARLTDLVLSPDGSRLVAAVQGLSEDKKRYTTALWEIDCAGGPPRRLTRGAAGESAPAFLPDGDLLFVSKRAAPVAPDDNGDGDEVAALWRLPAGGGEAEIVLRRPGGISRPLVASDAGTVVVLAPALAGPADGDAAKRKARTAGDVTAVLYESAPVRHWDHDLGPAHTRLFAVDAGADGWTLRDLTPDAGYGLEDVRTEISADGRTVVSGWRTVPEAVRESSHLVAIDVTSGERRVLAQRDERAEDQHEYGDPCIAPDGSWVAFVDITADTPERAPTLTLALIDLASGEQRDLLPGFDLWPSSPVASPDSSAVYFLADEAGHVPVWRVDIATGAVTRLTRSGSYAHLCPSPDGEALYALRSHLDSPARPVRLATDAADQDPVLLEAPGDVGALPGRLEEVETTAPDGARVRAFLALPTEADGPVPLLLWVHGGPLMSWNSWSWRWNPWLMVAHGYAVLLPDPGLSRGYGDAFVQRAWGQWGPVPFADLMAITDAVVARPDIDETRTAAMGGSYGGYMANWIAGHTDRFNAIVTHASLWSLEQFIRTTDHPGSWAMEWGFPEERPARYELNSPFRHAAAIRTPMLVIHGDKDYRVPIGEGLALWTDLRRHGVDAKFLYFPDEGHWILKPGNVQVWYETVLAFLAHHVRGAAWERPALL